MDFLLMAVVSGIFLLNRKPLQNWYVVELNCVAGGSRFAFKLKELAEAQREFDRLVEKACASALTARVNLWKVEARSRKSALKIEPAGTGRAVPELVKFRDIRCAGKRVSTLTPT
jgi:hypothetical protein